MGHSVPQILRYGSLWGRTFSKVVKMNSLAGAEQGVTLNTESHRQVKEGSVKTPLLRRLMLELWSIQLWRS